MFTGSVGENSYSDMLLVTDIGIRLVFSTRLSFLGRRGVHVLESHGRLATHTCRLLLD